MKIEPLSDDLEWNGFVANSPSGSFFHTLAWRDILEKSFGYESAYLVIRDDEDKLVGVCPFFKLKKMFFQIADSLPDSDICGPLIDEAHKKAAAYALRDHIDNGGCGRNLAYVRIKTQDKELYDCLRTTGSTTDMFSGTMVLDLEKKSQEDLWNTVLSKNHRKHITRFEQDGFITRFGESERDLEKFYVLYALNMKKRGLPPCPYAAFKNIFDSFYPARFNILLTEKEGRCFGAGIFFIYPEKNTLYGWNIGMDKSVGGRYKIQSKIYWEWIKYAHENGYRYLNYGSTPSDPSSKVHSLKKDFGAEFIQDYTINLPSNKKIFFVREGIVRAGRSIKNSLPANWVQKISNSI
jgi:serine/alanine adding enzyme